MPSIKIIFWSVITLLLLVGCGKDTSEELPDNTVSNELLELVNTVRVAGCNCGNISYPPVAKLVWSEPLEKIAQSHSEDMNEHQEMTHTSSDGSLPVDRLNAAGYGWFTFYENIAFGFSTNEEVINAWLDSKPHCINIMNADVTEMAIAKSETYWTQIFAKPK